MEYRFGETFLQAFPKRFKLWIISTALSNVSCYYHDGSLNILFDAMKSEDLYQMDIKLKIIERCQKINITNKYFQHIDLVDLP